MPPPPAPAAFASAQLEPPGGWPKDAYDGGISDFAHHARVEASLASYFGDLQAPSEPARLRGFRNLRIHIDVFAKSMAPEVYSRTMEDICDRLHTTLQTWSFPEVYSVVLAIESLISVRSVGELHDEAVRNCISRFVSFLRRIIGTLGDFVLPGTTADENEPAERDIWCFVIVQKAVAVLGRAAQQGCKLRMNPQALIEYDLHRAFEWLEATYDTLLERQNSSATVTSHAALQTQQQHQQPPILATHPPSLEHRSRRLIGLFLLKELAHGVPMVLESYLHALFSVIWAALQDYHCPIIREAGLECLRTTLAMTHERIDVLKSKIAFYGQVWKQIREGLHVNFDPLAPPPTGATPGGEPQLGPSCEGRATGALLALAELIDARNHSDRYMWPRFSLACVLASKFTKPAFSYDTREAAVRVAPRLAAVRFLTMLDLYMCGSSNRRGSSSTGG